MFQLTTSNTLSIAHWSHPAIMSLNKIHYFLKSKEIFSLVHITQHQKFT